MPSKSESQKRLFAAASHNKDFAEKVGIDQDTAKEWNKADQAHPKKLPEKVKETNEAIYTAWSRKDINMSKPYVHLLNNYSVSVKQEYIEALIKRVVIQYHRFPNTNSVVAHASIDGFELSVKSSPCIDARNFSWNTGVNYAASKVIEQATNKLWEMEGAKLLGRLEEYKDNEQEFISKFSEIYNITPV